MMKIPAFVNLVKTATLTTERLTLRKMSFEDLDVAMAHERDPRIMRYVKDIEDNEVLLKKMLKFLGDWHGFEGEWLSFSVLLADTEQVIGMVACRIESIPFRRVEIGYRFHPDFQGQGFCFEAIQCFVDFLWQQLKVHKLVAYCVLDNDRSFGMMEKLGMRREGCLKKHTKIAGQWHDELVYGMLKKHYLATKEI
jgi:[ribosomal protein S5]-alanine N-acetyltransferase